MAEINGTAGNDEVSGTADADTISTDTGADVITAGGGADVISAGGGEDEVDGGAGNDVIYGFGAADRDPSSGAILITEISNAFSSAVFAESAPGDPNRLFVVEQHSGEVKILDLATGEVSATPFLNIPDNQLADGGEQGLLGFTFHPDYESNGKVYVNLTNAQGDTEIREYTRSTTNPDRVDPASERLIMTFDQPFDNHNGGWLGFGPDGYLYIASGDGGSGGDPFNNAQNTDSLLGKILRIDVNGDDFGGDPDRNYAIPDDNPFASGAGADEVYHYGLRNPFRCSFDSLTGDFWIGDVGQGSREEVDFVAAGVGGLNFGWKVKEGNIVFDDDVPGNPDPNDPSLIDPLVDYRHTGGDFGGNVITGGYVYRGDGGAQGLYFFCDFGSGNLWTTVEADGESVDFLNRNDQLQGDLGDFGGVSSFAQDGNGNLYAITLNGGVYLISPGEAAADGADVLSGGEGDDEVLGGAGDDVLNGDAGNDFLVGGIQDDSLAGGTGDDVLEGGDGDDVLDGGEDIDRAAYTSAMTAVTVNLGLAGEQDTGGGGSDRLIGIENLIGSAFDDTLSGSRGANTIEGGEGRDTIDGDAGSDRLSGGLGIDTINGGAGRDLIESGEGKDRLTGGGGADIFAFIAIGATDRITDLANKDRIDLSLIDADAGTAGNQAFVLVGAFTDTAGEAVLAYSAAKDRTTLSLDVDGDGRADMKISMDGNHTDFTNFAL